MAVSEEEKINNHLLEIQIDLQEKIYKHSKKLILSLQNKIGCKVSI